MLNKKKFNENICKICTFNNVKIDKIRHKTLYDFLKNDFIDKQFDRVCNEIIKNDELYNKYPTPKMFYAKRKSVDQKRRLACECD